MNSKSRIPILLIEDNPGDVAIMKTRLDEAGIRYDLFHEDTLRDGLELLKKREIELALLDLNLPDSNGFRTLTTFLEKAPEVPVILITGMNNEIIGNQAVKAGAQDYLVKGHFDGKLLGRSIRYAIQRANEMKSLSKTAQELENAKRWFLEVQEMARLGTWELDLVTNKMHWTDEVYRILGFKPGAIIPTLSTYKEYVHPEDREAVEAFFLQASRDTQLHHIEHRIIVDGTSIRHVAVHAKLQMGTANGQIQIVGGIQDITERKLNEQLLLEKNISSKTASIQEEALAKMSFNIRTPLSSVTSLLHLMESAGLTPQQQASFGDLKTSVSDLSVAVNNLLNFTLMVSDTMEVTEEEVVLKEFVKGIGDVMQIKADAKQIRLQFELAPQLPEKVIADPRKINQVLYNLLDNAIKFTPEGGLVMVTVRGEGATGGKLNLQFSISDTGPGIDQEELDRILNSQELFTQNEGNDKKKLGLAIVNKLVQVMDGELKVDSKLGQGSAFRVTVPVTAVRKARFLAGGVPDVPVKILLVEDHPINQITTKKVLTAWSPHVSVDLAANGQKGVEMMEQNRYDLVLMDLQMPVMDGFDATQSIRKFSNVPIIALTANASVPEQERCLKVGMNDYLTKPFKPEELYAKVLGALSLVLN
ncbi:MAG: response regulator [Bacteroidetes bacterium]|nr:MAG: response regulator [Bacteroidota bacterium]